MMRLGSWKTAIAGTLALFTAAGAASAQPALHLGERPQQILGVALNVKDLERSRTFYKVVLGLKENPGSPVAGSAPSNSLSFSGTFDDAFLEIHLAGDKLLRGGAGLGRLVFKVTDVHGVVDRARKAGFVVLRDAASAHGMANLVVAVLQDPDGNSVEILELGGS